MVHRHRFFCPIHKISFRASNSGPIECISHEHVLGNAFPKEPFWGYCLGCRNYWPIEVEDLTHKQNQHCPACDRPFHHQYLCDSCQTLCLGDTKAAAQHHFFGLTNEKPPACPGCGAQARQTVKRHRCWVLSVPVATARNQCPFCHQPPHQDFGLPIPMNQYLASISARPGTQIASFTEGLIVKDESIAPDAFLLILKSVQAADGVGKGIHQPQGHSVLLLPQLLPVPVMPETAQSAPIVSKTGIGHYTTIGEAVAQAFPEAVIRIFPGVYEETVMINKPLKLVGEGEVHSIIIQGHNNPGLVVQSARVHIRGLTLRTTNTEGSSREAILITDCDVRFVNCVISSEGGTGCLVYGEKTMVSLKYCSIVKTGKEGILIYEGAQGLLKGCEIWQIGGSGMIATQRSQLRLWRCSITQAQHSGILVSLQANIEIKESKIFNNQHAGIAVTAEGTVTTEKSTIYNNNREGVYLSEKSSAKLTHCDVYGNTLAGISVVQKSFAQLEQCTIHDGKQLGIRVEQGSRHLVTNCKLYGNALGDIEHQKISAIKSLKSQVGLAGTQDFQTYQFLTVTLGPHQEIVSRFQKKAVCFIESLSDDVSLTMTKITGGDFWMGSKVGDPNAQESEFPRHHVTVRSFFIGVYLLTQAQWKAIMGSNPSRFRDDPDLPVEYVNFSEALEFCRLLSKRTGRTYTLPTEAQWEYACRAGAATPYAFGDSLIPEIAQYQKPDLTGKTIPVGSLKWANAFGLYDMHGNLWEWCLDPDHENYQNAPSDDRVWSVKGNKFQIIRGGSWSTVADLCRSAYRGRVLPKVRSNNIGFRVVLNL
ncbi:MAG: SUMF1/EgtB/PvdO family nonheme iron enzyme [Acidobacteria bacterium]|nr:SUMF1/EgtB/PvdO family nonheme iron enzyme [Acidobacteriota bacterium]